MGTPGKGMLLPTGKKLLISTGEPGIVQASGTCCECGCCLGLVYFCVCNTYGTLTANGTSEVIDVLDCCEGCEEVAATLELWVTCTDTVVTLNWEYVCGGVTDDGTADISDLCDEGEIKLFPDITVAGCTFIVSVFNYDAGETCCGHCLTWEGDTTVEGLVHTSTETNPDIPADPDDYLDLLEGPYLDLMGGCAGAEATMEFVWLFGRNAPQTRTVWVEWTHGGCLEYVSNDPDVDGGNSASVTHDNTTVTETATAFKVEWTYTDSAGEGVVGTSITFRVLSCCDCDFSFKIGGESRHARLLYTEWLCS